MTKQTNPYLEGYNAYFEGYDIGDNPHKKLGSKETAFSWIEGWLDAFKDEMMGGIV